MGMPWFRLYSEMIDDPKIGTLSDAEFRLWVEILCLACENGNGGDTNLTVSETEWKLRKAVSETVKKLLHIGIVTFQKRSDGQETLCVPKWNKRQLRSDTSTPRVQKFREKQPGNDDNPFP